MKNKFTKDIFSVLVGVFTVLGLILASSPIMFPMSAQATFYPFQAQQTQVHTGISSAATSVRIKQLEDLSGNIPTMASFGSIGYITFEPGTVREEDATFSGITNNGDGTVTLTGLTRGLRGKYPYGTGGTAHPHVANTFVVLSNSGEFYNEFALKAATGTIREAWTFLSQGLPVVHSTTTDAQLAANGTNTLATINYVNNTAAAGAANALTNVNGIVELATAAELAAGTGTGTAGSLAAPASLFSRLGIGGNVPVGDTTGRINGSWMATSTNNFWGAVQSFISGVNIRASSTANAIVNYAVLPESTQQATTTTQMTTRSMFDFNAYARMSTSTDSGSKVASTSVSMATNCNSTTVTKQTAYKIWRYGKVYVFASSTNSQAFQSSLYISVNGAGTTTNTNSTTNTMWISAVVDVTPGDEVQVWCSEDNASANLTGVSDVALFATSSIGEIVQTR